MKVKTALVVIAATLLSCSNNKTDKTEDKKDVLPLVGTWQIVSGLTIQKKDSTFTDYTKGKKGIKIVNGTHFSFLIHDLTKGKEKTPLFDVGGGHYTLNGDKYTEYLDYCNAREWENNKFDFTITIKNDTLTQTGIEKIDSIGVNRINIEKYVRVKGD